MMLPWLESAASMSYTPWTAIESNFFERTISRRRAAAAVIDSPWATYFSTPALCSLTPLLPAALISFSTMLAQSARGHVIAAHQARGSCSRRRRLLSQVAVRPAARRQGVRAALMAAYCDSCDEDGSLGHLETITWADPTRPSLSAMLARAQWDRRRTRIPGPSLAAIRSTRTSFRWGYSSAGSCPLGTGTAHRASVSFGPCAAASDSR